MSVNISDNVIKKKLNMLFETLKYSAFEGNYLIVYTFKHITHGCFHGGGWNVNRQMNVYILMEKSFRKQIFH